MTSTRLSPFAAFHRRPERPDGFFGLVGRGSQGASRSPCRYSTSRCPEFPRAVAGTRFFSAAVVTGPRSGRIRPLTHEASASSPCGAELRAKRELPTLESAFVFLSGFLGGQPINLPVQSFDPSSRRNHYGPESEAAPIQHHGSAAARIFLNPVPSGSSPCHGTPRACPPGAGSMPRRSLASPASPRH